MLDRTVLPEALLHQAPIGILQLSLDGGITYANPAFCKLTGYTEEQLRCLNNRAISHPEDFAAEVRLIQQMVDQGQGQQVLQKRYQCLDGAIVWTEVQLSLMADPLRVDSGADEAVILSFVTNISDRCLIEQEVRQYREREALLADLSTQLRTTFDLETVMQVVAERLRQTLAVDRVLTDQVFADGSGICLVEAIAPLYPSMQGQPFSPDCLPPSYLDAYRDGRVWATNDIFDEDLADCHKNMLTNVDVRSMMVAAIVSMDAALEPQRTLWGLLAVHCRTPRLWTVEEQRLLQVVATHLATAVEQTQRLQSLQQHAQALEDCASERTRSLARALKFEQLMHHLTETLRQHLDADQVIQAAVEGLTKTLNVDRCFVRLVNADQEPLTIRYECAEAEYVEVEYAGDEYVGDIAASLPSLVGRSLLSPPPDRCLLDTACASESTSLIKDDQGLLGSLTVCCSHQRTFASDEIALIEEVAIQCAIALRQSNFHCQEHDQRVSADYFRSFLETSTDVFVEYDSELRCLSMNAAGSTMLELPPDEIVGKTNQELFGTEAEIIDSIVQRAFDTGEKTLVNHELLLAQGSRIFETLYTPITMPSGAIQRVIGVSRDVTELKQQWQLLEQQNQQLTETTRVKQEFIATTSHELRTPLTAILGFSNVLLQGFFGALNPKQKDYLERIHDSGQHLLELINDILDLSRLEADRLELDQQAIFVPDICEGVMSLIRERALNQGLKLDIDLDPSIGWIIVDPRRLKQMLLNLLANAVKFTQEGTIGLKVYRQPLLTGINTAADLEHSGLPLLPGAPASEIIRFSVWDTGIGIDTASQHKLFSPFSQIDSSLAHKHDGTGLGLVITRKLAELHGGSVTLESSPNQGARFTISLPLHQPL